MFSNVVLWVRAIHSKAPGRPLHLNFLLIFSRVVASHAASIRPKELWIPLRNIKQEQEPPATNQLEHRFGNVDAMG